MFLKNKGGVASYGSNPGELTAGGENDIGQKKMTLSSSTATISDQWSAFSDQVYNRKFFQQYQFFNIDAIAFLSFTCSREGRYIWVLLDLRVYLRWLAIIGCKFIDSLKQS